MENEPEEVRSQEAVAGVWAGEWRDEAKFEGFQEPGLAADWTLAVRRGKDSGSLLGF